MKFAADYRMTVYAPRSVDATETTILTPRAGSPHADQFKVTTQANVAGWKSYMHAPRGRQGKIDPLKKTLTKGQISVDLLDARTTAGGSNAARWVTAFVGDVNGYQNLAGNKVFVEESIDGGASWQPYFMGRIVTPQLSGKIQFSFTIRDLTDDLDAEVFTGPPHSSIAYAFRASLAPVGLTEQYGEFSTVKKFRGMYQVLGAGSPGQAAIGTAASKKDGNVLLAGLRSLASHERGLSSTDGEMRAFDFREKTLNVSIAAVGGALIGEYELRSMSLVRGDDVLGRIQNVWFNALEPTHPRYAPISGAGAPANGGEYEWTIIPTWGFTESAPLIVNDVHPVQMMADLLDGKFGELSNAGAVVQAFPRNAASFAALIADTSIPTARFVIPGKARINDWIEKHLLRPYCLGWRISPNGEMVATDDRRPTSAAGLLTIGDADLEADDQGPEWTPDAGAAIRAFQGELFIDRLIPVAELKEDSPCTLIRTERVPIEEHNFGARALDVGGEMLTMEMPGYRSQYGSVSRRNSATNVAVRARTDQLREHIYRVADTYAGPFAAGPTFITLKCRRTANTDARPGELRLVTISTLPNPATNQRSGTRVVRIIDRVDEKLTRTLRALDLGATTVAVVPIVAAPVLNAADPRHAVDVGITRNAAGDHASLWHVVTDTAVAVRPGDTDDGWTPLRENLAEATRTISRLPAGRRVWVRARSEPAGGKSFTLPSAWAYPAGSGYVDTTALAAPSAAAVTNILTNTADLAWTNGEATREVEVLVNSGGVPGAWTDSLRVDTLPAGSKQYKLRGLDGPTVNHAVAVRHRDDHGGVSAVSQVSFTTGSTLPSAPRPAGRDVCGTFASG